MDHMFLKFTPRDKILVLDFDHTCYDTDAFLLFEIRQRMLREFDIPIKAWEESYEKAAKIGYSLETHRNELIKILKYKPCSLEEIKKFEKNIDFSKYLYPDVLSVLKQAKDKGYKLMLLSFGAVSWQNKKVTGVGFDKIMDVIKYTKEEKGKVGILKEYTQDCQKVIFVENNGLELDEVRKTLPYIETYFMNRVPSDKMALGDDDFFRMRYAESRKIAMRQVLLDHKHCSTFLDIIL